MVPSWARRRTSGATAVAEHRAAVAVDHRHVEAAGEGCCYGSVLLAAPAGNPRQMARAAVPGAACGRLGETAARSSASLAVFLVVQQGADLCDIDGGVWRAYVHAQLKHDKLACNERTHWALLLTHHVFSHISCARNQASHPL